VQLHGPVGECQSNAAAGFLGGEVEVENLVANFGGDSSAGVLHLEHGGLRGGEGAQGESAAVGHGLDAVDDDVEDGLAHEVGIDAHGQRPGTEFLHDFDAVGAGFGRGERNHGGGERAQIERGEGELDGTGEIGEGLDDAIQAVNFRTDDIDVAAGVRVGLEDALAQQFEVNDDGVDGILDLVSDAGGEASDGGETARYGERIRHRAG